MCMRGVYVCVFFVCLCEGYVVCLTLVVLMISKSTLPPPLFPRQMSPRYLYARHCQEIMFPTWLLLPPSRQISLRSLG